MPIKNGKQFLDTLSAEREIYIEGERVKDVISDPRFSGATKTMAHLMDIQSDPDLSEVMTYNSPTSGDKVGMTHIQPQSRDDVIARNDAIKVWMDASCGMMGRSPDYKNCIISNYAAAKDVFKRDAFDGSQNIQNFYEHVRENDAVTTHVLVNPQIDRSKPAHLETSDIVAQIVKETDAGIVIRGARMVATLCAMANELLVMPAAATWSNETRDTSDFSFGFAIPTSTPGLKFICRPPVAHTNAPSLMDHPLSLQYDESDGMVIFDDVLVPWERVFIHRDPDFDLKVNPNSYIAHSMLMQSVVRAQAKSEFMMALAFSIARSTKIDQHIPVQVKLAEMISMTEFVRSCRITAEHDAHKTEFGTWVGGIRPLQTWQTFFFEMYNRQCEIITTLGAGGLVAVPSFAEIAGDLKEDVEKYFQVANADAPRRIKLMRLAYDSALSSFAGRQRLYEQYYTGDPMRTQAALFNSYDKDTHIERVWTMLDELEKRA
ncbi:4-hydroxyphenylacetate 3-hydroxylase N-terminal domain-containing protein [Rhodospirillales bacterium]|nr:4-hydroxyphenylacetate 3-monooxygenase, oxygenase component [Rhodospirillaceae bacterium]MDC0989227.1 4-hydroxyphenylacetate 3-hydroxylase N-terminal domain-containing protein [Rhodospirillales bacterium]